MNIKKHVVQVAVVSSIADVLGEPVESIGESDNLVDDIGLDSVSAAQLLVNRSFRGEFPGAVSGSSWMRRGWATSSKSYRIWPLRRREVVEGLTMMQAGRVPVAELEDCSENFPLRFGVGRAGPD